eukprot:GFUD01039124.1.p1 GENE.GFUD01039124.1~~GFUD01039124.1.p1  ORF type:complete len:307 (-),score=76.67 GFUD01039124.1:95-1015(-)
MAGGSGEKFCLRWNDFETSISCAFQELRDDKDFFDVTLACEDNQVQAHKIILSACSPFFRSILRKNPHPHPLLYLKGVKHDDILAVLDFMYHGEVNVAQEALNSFLSVAEDLQVKGLTQTDKDQTKQDSSAQVKRSLETALTAPLPRPAKQQRNTNYQRSQTAETTHKIKTEAPAVYECEPEFDAGSEMVESDFQADQAGGGYEYDQGYDDQALQYSQEDGEQHGVLAQGALDFEEYYGQNTAKLPGGKGIQCLLCSKVTIHAGNMKQHFEVHHYQRTYKCEICQKFFKTKNSLDCHKKSQGHYTI